MMYVWHGMLAEKKDGRAARSREAVRGEWRSVMNKSALVVCSIDRELYRGGWGLFWLTTLECLLF